MLGRFGVDKMERRERLGKEVGCIGNKRLLYWQQGWVYVRRERLEKEVVCTLEEMRR